jgi:hypothetical protein
LEASTEKQLDLFPANPLEPDKEKMRRIGREWREDKVFRGRESANGTKSSRSIILDFWQVGAGSDCAAPDQSLWIATGWWFPALVLAFIYLFIMQRHYSGKVNVSQDNQGLY